MAAVCLKSEPHSKETNMSWTAHKKKLSKVDPEGLIRLIGDLYRLNSANRAFIEARLGVEEHSHADYRGMITAIFHPNWDEPLRLRDAKKAISDFRKACPDDLWGRVDLMTHYVEQGTEYTMCYGDIDEPFYDSVCSVLDNIVKVSHGLSASQLQCCRERIGLLETIVQGKIGWGYADHLADVYEKLCVTQPLGE